MGNPDNACFKQESPFVKWLPPTTTSSTTTPQPDFFLLPASGKPCPAVYKKNNNTIIPGGPLLNNTITFVCSDIRFNPNPCVLQTYEYIRIADIIINQNQCIRYRLELTGVDQEFFHIHNFNLYIKGQVLDFDQPSRYYYANIDIYNIEDGSFVDSLTHFVYVQPCPCTTTTTTTPEPEILGLCCEQGVRFNYEIFDFEPYKECLGIMSESACGPYFGIEDQRTWNPTENDCSYCFGSTTTTTTLPPIEQPGIVYVGLAGWDYGDGRAASFSNVCGLEDFTDVNFATLFKNICIWLTKEKVNPKIMLLRGYSPHINNITKNTLLNISDNVYLSPFNWSTFNNTSNIIEDGMVIDLNEMDLLIIPGDYSQSGGASFRLGDMSAVSQNLIKNFVHNGGGLLTMEWILWLASNAPNLWGNKLQILKDVLPLVPSREWDQKIAPDTLTYSVATHDPIVSNSLPSSWSWIPSNLFGTRTKFVNSKLGSTIFYYSS